MDFFLFILLLALLFPPFVIWRLVSLSRRTRSTGEKLDRLERRLAAVESGVSLRSPQAEAQAVAEVATSAAAVAPEAPAPVVPPPERAPAPEIVSSTVLSQPAAATPVPPPPPPPRPAPPPGRTRSLFANMPKASELESLIGGNWLNKIGMVVLVIGVTWFLGFSLQYLGPSGKTLMGVFSGLVLMGGGVYFERRPRYIALGRTLLGGGWAVLYLTAFAAYNLKAAKVIDDPALALAALTLVASGMIVHSLRYRSETVTSLAYGLAFLAVAISPVTLFSLLATAILAASLIAVLRTMPWYHLALVGVAATYVVHALWLGRSEPPSTAALMLQGFWLSEGTLALYWVLFVVQVLIRKPASGREGTIAYALNLANTVGFVVLSIWQVAATYDRNLYLFTAAATAAYAATAYLLRVTGRPALFQFNALVAVALGAITFPLAGRVLVDSGHWIGVYWAAEAALVLLLGFRLRHRPLRIAAYALAGLAILAVFELNLSAPFGHRPIVMALAVPPVIVFLYGLFEWLHRRAGKGEVLAVGEELGVAFGYAATTLLAAFAWWEIRPEVLSLVWLVLAAGFIELGIRTSRVHIRGQGYYLALVALGGFLAINLYGVFPTHASLSRWLTVGPGVVVLYAVYERLGRSAVGKAAPAFERFIFNIASCGATLVFAALLWKELNGPAVALAWCVLAVILFELGASRPSRNLRQQGHVLMAATVVRLFMANFTATGDFMGVSHRLLSILPVVAILYYLLYRVRGEKAADKLGRSEGRLDIVYSYAAAALLGILARFELGRAYAVIAWAPLMVTYLALGVRLRERDYRFQSYVLALFAFSRSWTTNLLLEGSYYGVPERFATTVPVILAFLVCALICLRYRDRFGGEPVQGWRRILARIDRRAVTLFAILAPGLVAILLANEVSGNLLTIAWATEAIVVLGFGFAVTDRSFRYVGLALMLASLLKLVVIDLQEVETLFRIISYIVLGVILLLASFAYARYRERIGRHA